MAETWLCDNYYEELVTLANLIIACPRSCNGNNGKESWNALLHYLVVGRAYQILQAVQLPQMQMLTWSICFSECDHSNETGLHMSCCGQQKTMVYRDLYFLVSSLMVKLSTQLQSRTQKSVRHSQGTPGHRAKHRKATAKTQHGCPN